MKTARLALLAALTTLGCATSAPVQNPTTPVATEPPAGAPQASASAAGTSTPGHTDAPEISRGVGATGGIVIFWPRVSPRTEDAASREIASRIQGRLRTLAERAMPGRTIDVRPEPERVCPRAGCTGMTLGAMLAVSHGACVALALVSAPGTSSQRIVPWGGRVDLRGDSVGFREPPEPQVVARDMVPCADLVDSLAGHDEDVVNAIRAAAPSY